MLPGHGGLLDRLDSVIAAVSVYYAGSKLLEIFFR
ncbi:MAG: phosphatidate cytidylyltransferase [Candidatus Methylumidiphilus sp.]